MLSAILFVIPVLIGVASGQVTEASPNQPIVIRAVAPLFPVPGEDTYAVGSVIVEIQIDARGTVIKAQAVQGHPFLYPVSVKAAQRWLFASTVAETKVRTVRLTFIFKVMDSQIIEEDLSAIFMPPYQIEVRRKARVIETRNP
jgi:hypothetical protein